MDNISQHRLLIANRGEIAVRIIKTANRLQIPTVSIYCQPDADAAHVLLADEAIAINPNDTDPSSNARGYMDGDAIVQIAKDVGATLLHPGYGFLSENADFAQSVLKAGITWLGPSPEVVHKMGLKDQARAIAKGAQVPVVPGSNLLGSEEEALKEAKEVGYPVMLKAAGGGGGMGLVICNDERELKAKFNSTKERAKVWRMLIL